VSHDLKLAVEHGKTILRILSSGATPRCIEAALNTYRAVCLGRDDEIVILDDDASNDGAAGGTASRDVAR